MRTWPHMAPRKGETSDAKAQRYNRQAALFLQKARFERVVKVLKARPDVLPDVERQLKDLGVLEVSNDGAAAVEVKELMAEPVTPGKGDSGHGVKGEQGDEDEEGDACSAQAASSPANVKGGCAQWDRNTTKFGQVPVSVLKRALQTAGKNSFSSGNVKAVVKRGARDPSQSFLCQCVELMTNMDPAATIEARYRSVEGFCELVVMLNMENGRRARDLVLADAIQDWEPHGVYSLDRTSAARLKISHKYKNLVATISVDKDGDYYIDGNFSEMRAIIRDRNSDWRKPATVLFPKELGQAVAKRRPKAKPPTAAKAEDPEDDGSTGLAMPVKPPRDDVAQKPAAVGDVESKKRTRPAGVAEANAQKLAKIPRPRTT